MPVSTEDASWGYAGYYVHDFSSIVDEKLDRLALLHENWDCEGAKRIDPAIIQAARQFISRLPEDIGSLPAVVPIARGTLQFEWSKGTRSLELEIESPSVIRYLQWDSAQGLEEEESFDIKNTNLAAALIQWFMKGAEDV